MTYTSDQIDTFRELARKCFAKPTISIDESGMVAFFPSSPHFRYVWEPAAGAVDPESPESPGAPS